MRLIDSEILKCQSRLIELDGSCGLRALVQTKKPLIISTGDISDVDGFLALAKYATTGADVLFIMNYPSFLDPAQSNGSSDNGLGFNFPVKNFLKESFDTIIRETGADDSCHDAYRDLLTKYNMNTELSDVECQQVVKGMFTDLGFILVKNVWENVNTECDLGDLFFCVGGINSISPFCAGRSNELFIYADYLLSSSFQLRSSNPDTTYNMNGDIVGIDSVFETHGDLYMDFNGSMAFFKGSMQRRIQARLMDLKGVFVMGGVLSWEKAKTMPKIDGVLNRFSCATMNQLYSPVESASFFSLVQRMGVSIFFVTNNVVHDLAINNKTGEKTPFGWRSFLKKNCIHSEYLEMLASRYYNCYHHPPKKAFDFYVALALTEHMKRGTLASTVEKLYYDSKYGLCVIGHIGSTWSSAREEYFGLIDMVHNASDNLYTISKKHNFTVERNFLYQYNAVKFMNVSNLAFELDSDLRLSIKPNTG